MKKSGGNSDNDVLCLWLSLGVLTWLSDEGSATNAFSAGFSKYFLIETVKYNI